MHRPDADLSQFLDKLNSQTGSPRLTRLTGTLSMSGRMRAFAAALICSIPGAPAVAADNWFVGTPAAPCARYNAKLEPINPGSWFLTVDYPAAALREEREGRVEYRLTVGKTGRVSKVRILSAAWPDLGVATATALTRYARFKPAMRKCLPTAAYFAGAVNWVLPTE